MTISIPIFILAIIIGIIYLWTGFRIKGKQPVFGRVLSTNSQTWARFWLTTGWVIIIIAVCYILFMIILHFYLSI
ncbi:hypothetical protein [Lactobacillus taiwanensis]|uniref:hypothetical protein n=1 Tax=Lactobacillus taiwanensis TaxID=508451 RepID=UPI000B98814C|nr:hypothetical protein [Lactobacillus taiwanensis]OYR97719.1 hypothetical protein CBF51_02435 [Lactobacillus taiwanensis]OYS02451.1 hypothetical protein CBF61_02845 [Lactobacillus taiwanensis]OYS13744.1 hypothetical protein CBF69_08770 [Lactobacillus taiwanensis]OYS33358.1 hypothetical protein CBF75_01010 [Lactobacillus taiwanensis]OYS33846.1 hypothetical protein CBF78_04465 [Lactobacillus taiwanensis]